MRTALTILLIGSAFAFAAGPARRTAKVSRRTPNVASAPIVSQTPVVPAGSRFVMSHFKSNNHGGDERLYISVSPDALNWTALNGGNPVWQPVGWAGFENVVRDPAIIFNSGYYWVAYTSGHYGRHASFGLVKSTDLLNWTLVGEIACVLPGRPGSLLGIRVSFAMAMDRFTSSSPSAPMARRPFPPYRTCAHTRYTRRAPTGPNGARPSRWHCRARTPTSFLHGGRARPTTESMWIFSRMRGGFMSLRTT